MLRVVTLSTLFPDATRPNFGVFVERQTLGLAALPGTSVQVVAGIGLPPWPIARHSHYRALAQLPVAETWRGLPLHRPRFLALPGTGGRFHGAALARAAARVLDPLAGSFDVIDASFFFPDGPAAVTLGRRYGVPVSIKARGADIHHWGRSRPNAAQVRRAGQAADGLLAVSAAMREDMVAIGLPRERIRIHRTGVDQARFAPVDRQRAKTDLGIAGPLVVSVGALIPRKGHEIVIDAIGALPGVTLAIAGDGPERAALERQVARLGLAERVRLLGSVAHDDLPRWLAAADAMALASASEGLANAWVEALACGTPLVVADAGGAREVVTAPAAGRIVPRTPAAFAAALAALIAAPPAASDTRRYAAAFTWEANAAALRDHLARLVATGRYPRKG